MLFYYYKLYNYQNNKLISILFKIIKYHLFIFNSTYYISY